MLLKVVLFIVASEGYHPVEYGFASKELEDAGIKVIVASDKKEANAQPSINHSKICNDIECTKVVSNYPQYAKINSDLELSKVNPEDYDGIFIIGGPGAMEFLDNENVYDLIRKVKQLNKPFGAICISPRILAYAGVLHNRKATGWNGDNRLNNIFKEHHIQYIKEPVVIDKNIITADGPKSATLFGKAILKLIYKKK